MQIFPEQLFTIANADRTGGSTKNYFFFLEQLPRDRDTDRREELLDNFCIHVTVLILVKDVNQTRRIQTFNDGFLPNLSYHSTIN